MQWRFRFPKRSKMKMSYTKYFILLAVAALATSCFDPSKPNYQYMPDMYEAVSYEAYQEVDFLSPEEGVAGQEAMLPPEHTIARGYLPFEYDNTIEGKDMARLLESPLDSLNREENLAKGKELYDIYCAICHGAKGDGKGWLVEQEKILGVPNYNDAARNISVGSTYHTIYYGLNSMGSYSAQLGSEEKIWQVSEYVMKLKSDLTQ